MEVPDCILTSKYFNYENYQSARSKLRRNSIAVHKKHSSETVALRTLLIAL